MLYFYKRIYSLVYLASIPKSMFFYFAYSLILLSKSSLSLWQFRFWI